ncbi:MAG: T9SS type A sorting domain-containing protein [Ignavibacteriaceae bacterium]|nr:T9SS type A sorting domain-containing protein [Ignavibacteriaceae bacterium]
MYGTIQKNQPGFFRLLKSFSLMILISLILLGANSLVAQSSSLSMNGSSYIEVPDAPNLRLTGSMTIEAWIYLDDAANNTIIDKGSYNYLFETHPNGQPALGLYSRSFGWIYSGGSLPINQWVHVAVSFKTGANGVNFYINGALVSSHTMNTPLASDAGPVNIARQDPLGCQCNKMNGDIDELRIWNVARTQTEIAANMTHGNLCDNAGLAAYFSFDENVGNTVSSSVGGHVGTIINPAGTAWVPGVSVTPTSCTLQTLTILGGSGVQGEIDQYTEASRDGGATWQPAYLTGWHPWGFAAGTNSWINFDPSPFVGLNSTTDYRIRFNVPTDFSSPHMTFTIKADNRAWLSINGAFISQIDGESTGAAGDQVISQALLPGLNEITIRLQDFGGWVGLNYRIDITMFSDEVPSLEPSTFSNTAPVANVGQDQTIDCAPTAGSTITLDGSSSTDADGDALTYSWSNSATTAAQTLALAPGTHTFTLTVNDGNGGSSSDNVVITINADVTAPVVTAPAALVVNATVLGGFVGAIGTATVTDVCDPNPTITNNAPAQFPLGETVVTWTATDANGNTSSALQSVTVKQSTMLAKSLTIPILQALLPVSKNVDKKIGEAIKDIQQSVKAELWTDEYHLSTKKGEKVFEEEKEAVNQLLSLLKSDDHDGDDDDDHDGDEDHDGDDDHDNKNNSIDEATQATLLTVILTLVDADKAIATLAFTEAQANCTSSKCLKKLDEANKKMIDAQKMFVAKKYAQAIDKYKSAWKSIIEINGKSFHKDGNQDLTQQSGEIPSAYGLSQNYPNPFNPTTVIDFAITESGYYTLKIYNTLGQEVAELVNDQLEGGNYSFGFDASKLASGLYIYNIKGTNVNISKKMILMK